jgi:hypothetical protein
MLAGTCLRSCDGYDRHLLRALKYLNAGGTCMYRGKGVFGIEWMKCTAIVGSMRVVSCSRLLVNTFFVVIRAIIVGRLRSW